MTSPPLRPATARDAALEAIRLACNSWHIQKALDKVLGATDLKLIDRQFATDLAYGYFRTLRRLDFILDNFLKNPQKLPPQMMPILRLAVYSLLFQEGVPAFAAINEAVNSIKKKWGNELARVANGVLRAIDRHRDNLENIAWYVEKCGDSMLAQAVFYSLPQTVATLWIKSYGADQAVKLMRRSFLRPWAGIRLNPRHSSFPELKEKLADLIRIGRHGYAIPPGGIPDFLAGRGPESLYAEGAFTFQSAGSMAVMEELGLYKWADPVWDACCGIGGKSAPLAECAIEIGLASDSSMSRLKTLPAFFKRLALPVPPIAVASAATPPLAGWHGNILLDVPCSGLGVLARRPDIKIREPDLVTYAKIQGAILRSAQKYLKAGRELAYITCTLNPAENELAIRSLLVEFPDLKLIKEWHTPHDHPWMEGMYGALLRR